MNEQIDNVNGTENRSLFNSWVFWGIIFFTILLIAGVIFIVFLLNSNQDKISEDSQDSFEISSQTDLNRSNNSESSSEHLTEEDNPLTPEDEQLPTDSMLPPD